MAVGPPQPPSDAPPTPSEPSRPTTDCWAAADREPLEHVLRHLPYRARGAAACVSKWWRAIASDGWWKPRLLVLTWGADDVNGSGDTLARPSVLEWPPLHAPAALPLVALACAHETTYALDAAGSVWWWGAGWCDAVGAAATPAPVPGLREAAGAVASVTCTAPGFVATNYRVHHAVVTTEGGALYSWGSNVQGQAHHADPRPVVARPTRVLGFGNENGSDGTFGFRPGGEDGGAVVARSVLRVACGKWFTVAQVYNEQVMDEGAIEAGLEREAAAAARAEAMAAMMEEVEVEEAEEAVEGWNGGMVVATVAEDGTPVMVPGPMGDPIVVMPDPILAVPMMAGEEAEGLEGAVGPPAAALMPPPPEGLDGAVGAAAAAGPLWVPAASVVEDDDDDELQGHVDAAAAVMALLPPAQPPVPPPLQEIPSDDDDDDDANLQTALASSMAAAAAPSITMEAPPAAELTPWMVGAEELQEDGAAMMEEVSSEASEAEEAAAAPPPATPPPVPPIDTTTSGLHVTADEWLALADAAADAADAAAAANAPTPVPFVAAIAAAMEGDSTDSDDDLDGGGGGGPAGGGGGGPAGGGGGGGGGGASGGSMGVAAAEAAVGLNGEAAEHAETMAMAAAGAGAGPANAAATAAANDAVSAAVSAAVAAAVSAAAAASAPPPPPPAAPPPPPPWQPAGPAGGFGGFAPAGMFGTAAAAATMLGAGGAPFADPNMTAEEAEELVAEMGRASLERPPAEGPRREGDPSGRYKDIATAERRPSEWRRMLQAGDATTALRLSDGTRVTLRGRGGAAAGGQLIASYLSIETWGAFGARSSLHAMQGARRAGNEPRDWPELRNVRLSQLAAGAEHCCALTEDGELFTFGQQTGCNLSNGNLLGHGPRSAGWASAFWVGGFLSGFALPRKVAIPAPVVEVSCSTLSTAAVTSDGRVFTWGDCDGGALGHGNRLCDVPTEVDLAVTTASAPAAASAPADITALLAHAGLAEYTDAFVAHADGLYDDVEYVEYLRELLQEHNSVFEEELRDLGLTAAQLAALRAALRAPPAEAHEQEEDGRSGVHASPRRPAHISHAALSYTNGAALAADGSLYVWGGGAWGGGGWEGAGISGAPQGDDGVRPSRLETVAVDPAYACVGDGAALHVGHRHGVVVFRKRGSGEGAA